MSSLVSSDLAPVSAGKDLFLFYQNNAKILSAHAAEGGAWSKLADPIAEDLSQTSAAITAYYVEKDVDLHNKPTIHVLYINQSGHLVEKARELPNGPWQNIAFPDKIKGPITNSRLTSGSYNHGSSWNQLGSQWVYYVSLHPPDNNSPNDSQVITEIRRTPNGPWYTETILPEKRGEALPAASLAVTIVQGAISLFFQNHEENIILYENLGSHWSDEKVYIKKEKVGNSSPIAAARESNNSKAHVFFASRDEHPKIIHHYNGKEEEIGKFYPGTKLGAAYHNGDLNLFYKILNPVGEVHTLVYKNGKWSPGVKVLSA